jgi:hypothetical protein
MGNGTRIARILRIHTELNEGTIPKHRCVFPIMLIPLILSKENPCQSGKSVSSVFHYLI